MMANPELRLSAAEFLALPEYSTSIPTGTTIGKRWRRHHRWLDRQGVIRTRLWIGEYTREIIVPDKVVCGDLPPGGKGPLVNLRCAISVEVLITWFKPIIRVSAISSKIIAEQGGDNG